MSRSLLAVALLGLSALPAAAGGGCVGDCYRQTYVPPSYENVTERYMVRAPRTYAMTTPAQYRTVYETVQVSAGGRHWSVTQDAYGNKVGCWIVTKPRFASVARTVMVQAPQVVPYSVPAQYGVRNHSVQTSPGYKAWAPVGRGGYGHGGGYGGGYRAASYGGGYGGGYQGGGYQGGGYGGGLVGGALGAGAGLAGAGLNAGFGLAGGALDAVGF